jgi:cellulose synthase/poly-beta-1,6-N-acetylglucosamine synthase-like glycosyltransferase
MWLIPAMIAFAFLMMSLFLFPALMSLLSPIERPSKRPLMIPKTIDVLIPCHNEEGRLAATLQSIFDAADELTLHFPETRVQVFCGLDDCTDKSESELQKFHVNVRHFRFRSKWRVITALIDESRADWVALADCGVVWDRRFLRNALPYLAQTDVAGFSPSYLPFKCGILGRIHWSLEALIKSLENKSGGPVSVHGASVLYRSDLLKDALRVLVGRIWINDDVVLPLMIRSLNPAYRMIYSRNRKMGYVVRDCAVRAAGTEKAARLRVSRGNLQWLIFLFPFAARLNKRVIALLMRRVVRLFWALIPLLCALSAGLLVFESIDVDVLPRTTISLALVLFIVFCAKKVSGFEASLKAFWAFFFGPADHGEDVLWN